MNNKKIIVTGASGFLGRNLLKYLSKLSYYNVIALSSRPDEINKKFKDRNIQAFENSVAFSSLAKEIFKDSIVINCAYPRISTGSEIAEGLNFIQNIFQSAVDFKASAIINISSQSVYLSTRAGSATEDDGLNLENTYAVGKFAVELLLESICRKSATYFTNLRLASLIGPDFDQRIVNRMVKQAIETGEISFEEGGNLFGFLDIEDACLMIIRLLQNNPSEWKTIYNIGPAKSYILSEIATIIKEIFLNKTGKSISLNIKENKGSFNSSLDSSLFYRDFGNMEYMPMEASVEAILNYLLYQ